MVDQAKTQRFSYGLFLFLNYKYYRVEKLFVSFYNSDLERRRTVSNWFRRGLIVVFWSVGLATTDLFAASMALLLGQIKATFLVTLFASLTGGTIFYLLGKDDLVLKSSTWITQQEEKLRGKRLVEWCLRRGKLFTILIIAAVSGPMSAALALRLFGYKDTRSYVQIGVNAFLFALVWAGVIWGIPACFIRKAL